MNNNFKNIGLFIILIILVSACQDDDEMQNSINECRSSSLETISDGENCNDPDFFLICETVDVDELNTLEDEDFDWIPMLCNNIGESIQYKNDINETFDITITDKNHYINKVRIGSGCDLSIEHISYICQSNETAFIEFSSSIFDDNLTKFELYRQINEVKDGNLGSPKLRFTLEQPRTNTIVHNFLYRVTVDDEKENRSQEFHKNLTINEKDFTNVYELFIRETFWGDPKIIVYINKGNGILGFKVNNKFWLRDI